MSQYRYNMTLTGNVPEEISAVIAQLEANEVIPYILKVDMTEKDRDGKICTVYLSTEMVTAAGTSSCWPKDEHEKLLHELSVSCPSVTLELTGENLDDPNNGIFQKAFNNGLYKEAYQEKQDVSALLGQATWRPFNATEQDLQKAEVFSIYNTLAGMTSNENYYIASDMAYLEQYVELDDPLTDEELFILASKIREASSSWFGQPLLHEEHLDAVRYLLEYGINKNHSSEFPLLNAEQTRKMLLSADNEVFGTLVEVAAINNREHYYSVSQYKEEDLLSTRLAVHLHKSQGENTKFIYAYRDAANYRTPYQCIFPGAISPAQLQQFLSVCQEEDGFIPSLLGLPGGVLADNPKYDPEFDHPWCEHFMEDSFLLTDEKPTTTITVEAFLDGIRRYSGKWEEAYNDPSFTVPNRKLSLADQISSAQQKSAFQAESTDRTLPQKEH